MLVVLFLGAPLGSFRRTTTLSGMERRDQILKKAGFRIKHGHGLFGFEIRKRKIMGMSEKPITTEKIQENIKKFEALLQTLDAPQKITPQLYMILYYG